MDQNDRAAEYTDTVSYVSLSRDVMQLVMNTCHIIGVMFPGEPIAFNSKNYYLPIPQHFSHIFFYTCTFPLNFFLLTNHI